MESCGVSVEESLSMLDMLDLASRVQKLEELKIGSKKRGSRHAVTELARER